MRVAELHVRLFRAPAANRPNRGKTEAATLVGDPHDHKLAATGVESDVALWFASGALITGGFMVLLGSRRRSGTRSGSRSLRV